MKLLTDIQICELMGWRQGYGSFAGLQRKHWVFNDCIVHVGTPNFDTMNPIFEFVIPWLKTKRISVSMINVYTFLLDDFNDKFIKNEFTGTDKDPALALRKALTEYANRSK